MAKNTFYDKDLGYADLVTRMDSPGGSVFVGFLRSSGEYKQKQGKDAMTVAQVAAIHEFGSKDGTIPERSFMRSALSQGKNKIEKLAAKLTGQVTDGAMDEQEALGVLGEFVKGLMKTKITDGLSPPLKAATIKRKGSSTPLIDTAQLINSIDWSVTGSEKP